MAEKKGTLLSGVQGITPEVLEKLSAYWITTAEELISAAAQEGGLSGLVVVTGLSQDEVVHLVELAQAALPPGVSFAPGEPQAHGMGALDEPNPDIPNEEGPVSFAPLPTSVDLHDHFGEVRNQGQRGTCVAHACTAVREYLTGQQSLQSDFSEQFLYWDCKKHDLFPGEGTFIRIAMDRLKFDGIPAEKDWPYNPHPIPGNEGQGPEPGGILGKAGPNRIGSFIGLAATNVDGLRQALVNGSPVAFSVPVYSHWFIEPTNSSGDIRMPLPGEKVEGGHAMCMVGYEADPSVPGGGYFLIRNSWGTSWAGESAVAPGYARLPFAFISQFGKSAYIAEFKTMTLWARIRAWFQSLFA